MGFRGRGPRRGLFQSQLSASDRARPAARTSGSPVNQAEVTTPHRGRRRARHGGAGLPAGWAGLRALPATRGAGAWPRRGSVAGVTGRRGRPRTCRGDPAPPLPCAELRGHGECAAGPEARPRGVPASPLSPIVPSCRGSAPAPPSQRPGFHPGSAGPPAWWEGSLAAPRKPFPCHFRTEFPVPSNWRMDACESGVRDTRVDVVQSLDLPEGAAAAPWSGCSQPRALCAQTLSKSSPSQMPLSVRPEWHEIHTLGDTLEVREPF